MEKTIKLFEQQFNAFNFKTQFGAAVAGVQSGKTFCGAYWAGKKMQEFPTKNGLIVAPYYKILQSATLNKLFSIFPQLRKYHREQRGEIQLPTGGIVYIRSADNPLGIEGITADWVWLDEGGMTSSLTWTVLRSRVSMTGGQVFITTTPYNMGWMYKDFYKPWKEGQDKSLSFFTWKSVDNPAFSKEYFEAESRRLTPQEFARRYCGEFQKMSGLIFDVPQEQQCNQLDSNTKTEARIMGVDWGFRNPAAISVIYLKDNCYYLVDEWKESEKTTEEIIQVINNKIKEHKITKVYPDPAEPDRIEECKRKNVPVYEANKDVKGGISNIQTLIKEKRFFVCNNCVQTLEELSMYHWVEMQEDKLQKEEPEKVNDHLCFTKDVLIKVPNGKVLFKKSMGFKDVYEFMGSKVTSNHPYLTQRGWVRLDSLRYSDRIIIWKNKLLTELFLDDIQTQKGVSLSAILFLLQRNVSAIKQNAFIDIYGKNILVKYLRVVISIIRTVIRLIILWIISNLFHLRNIYGKISRIIEKLGKLILKKQLKVQANGLKRKKEKDSDICKGKEILNSSLVIKLKENAINAEKNMLLKRNLENTATIIAKLKHLGKEEVFAITTSNGFFLANTIVVSNCDAFRYAIHSYMPAPVYNYKPTSPVQPYYPELGF